MFTCFSVISAASASIHPQPSHRMRPLVGLLCGAMVTPKPLASRTSEFSSVNDREKIINQFLSHSSRSLTNLNLLNRAILIGESI